MRPIVLMSTFNGSRHVAQQIDSILTQLPACGRLLIRDDGSSDGTVEIARGASDQRVSIFRGQNIGFAKSFLQLLRTAPDDADLYLLSDQDDVWLPGKLDRAWLFLEPLQKDAALYCGRATLTDPSLRPIGLTPTHRPAQELRHALLQNIATGCTMAMTRPLKDLATRAGPLAQIGFHDWWLYVVATAFGKVIFDERSTTLYRQHGTNVIGMSAGTLRYAHVLRYLMKTNWLQIANRQIGEFRVAFDKQLTEAQRMEVTALQKEDGALNRAGVLLSLRPMANTLMADILLRALVAIDLRSTTGDD
jgi:glycosyltransferase involved in cell wall biosynthesis